MLHPDFIILYVNNAAESAEFYTDLLKIKPVELSATFAMFKLDTGLTLALWSKKDTQPPATLTGGGAEICFTAADANDVQRLYEDWVKRGLPVIQEPTDLGFGATFVALDPDQHRLRVYSPKAR